MFGCQIGSYSNPFNNITSVVIWCPQYFRRWSRIKDMPGRLITFLLLFSIPFCTVGQQLPVNGARLNYTQIMFDHPEVFGAEEYTVQVALNNQQGQFDAPVKEWKDSSTASMVSGFNFGERYIWRYAGIHNGKKLEWQRPFAFEILKDIYADTNYYRVTVLTPNTDIKTDGLIALDEMRTIVDRRGSFVWFLPEGARSRIPAGAINDLRLTPAGTLTFIEGKKAIETDLNGNKLWQAPKDTTPDGRITPIISKQYNYTHCFMRLPNGNYMVQCKIYEPVPVSLIHLMARDSVDSIPEMQYDIIKEFDKKGILTWSWNSKNYFSGAELKEMIETQPDSGILAKEPGGHLNAFNVDDKGRYVFAGFRNISRVVKIDKLTGKAEHSWGSKMTSGGADEGDGFFLKQHDVSLLADGSIAVFSNGNIAAVKGKPLEPSEVVVFSQPSNGLASKVIWRYECKLGDMPVHSVRGGNISELKNGNLLVCMGNVNRIFEVTRNKQIVWQAQVAKYVKNISMWIPKSLYRVHYTSSLYPCYFSIQTGCDTLTGIAASFNLKIFNNGSEGDAYVVNISSSSGNYQKHFSTNTVQSGKYIVFNIAPGSVSTSNEKVSVSVTSQINPDLEKIAALQFIPTANNHAH